MLESETAKGDRRRGSSRAKLWLLLAALLLLLALGQRPLREVLLPRALPTGEAHWIWPRGGGQRDGPLAVYAVRDFRLEQPPRQAEILILADEEYVLRLNGALVGANRYRPGAPLDRYRVDGLLQEGLNRILVNLRSSRGDGGLLFSLEMPGATPSRVVSDDLWRIVGRHLPRILEGGELPVLTYPPEILGLPPTGRWGRLSTGPLRIPLYERLSAAPEAPDRAVRGEGAGLGRRPVSGSGADLGAAWVTFDWGREVTGHLVIRFRQNRVPPALLFVGSEPPAPREDEPAALILGVPGQDRWLDSRPRTFRYATIVATAPVKGAALHPVALEAGDRSETGEAAGVFGLRAPRSRTPIEHEVWREVERLSSLAVGEDL